MATKKKPSFNVETFLTTVNGGRSFEPVIPKVSQETLAEMVGTTRSRINTFMNKFRRLGFIDYNGDIKVNFALMNMVLHETPQIKGCAKHRVAVEKHCPSQPRHSWNGLPATRCRPI